jgi:hypothetical protein
MNIQVYGEFPTRPVIFAACDSVYFDKFAGSFVESAARQGLDIHIHVVNPTENTCALAVQMNALVETQVTYSFHDVDLKSEPFQSTEKVMNAVSDKIRTYYACVRFMLLPHILKAAGKVLTVDIDCLVMNKFEFPERAVAYFPRDPLPGTTGWEAEGTRVAAGAFYLDNRAQDVADFIADYLKKAPLKWFVDQIALSEAVKRVPPTQIETYSSKFMDWEFKEGTTIWTGKGPRKYENKTYVDMQNKFYLQMLSRLYQYKKVICKPRLDIPFKVCLATRGMMKEPIRKHWKNFVDTMTDKQTLVMESPRWMFIPMIQDRFPSGTKFYVPHVEKHNWGGREGTTFYYMQTVFPWLFTADEEGWAGGAKYIETFDPEAEFNEQPFLKLQKYIAGGSKFQHLQSKTTDWTGINKDNFIVVPLQLPHDETIKYHSDISCEEFVTALCEFADNYAGCPQLVFKGHPVNLKSMEPLKAIIKNYKNVHYTAQGNFHDLVRAAQGMWVLNGGSGQEAMLLEKPVACFARCDYAPAVIQGDIKDMGTMWNKFFPLVASKSIEGNPVWEERLDMYKRWYDWYLNKIVIDTTPKV